MIPMHYLRMDNGGRGGGVESREKSAYGKTTRIMLKKKKGDFFFPLNVGKPTFMRVEL